MASKKINFKKLFNYLILITIVFSSCETKRLESGTIVLKRRFTNISKFDSSIYKQIDTNYFYKGIGICFTNNSMTKFSDCEPNLEWLKMQFYPDGHIRTISKYRIESPDPSVTGMRGVIYLDRDKLRIDHQSAYVKGIYKGRFKVKVKGNRIYMVEQLPWLTRLINNNHHECEVYEKADLVPGEWKKYKPDW